jgi:hypothetical protein
MNSIQIDSILKRNCHTKKYFKGVYSSNNIPLLEKYPHCFIANTDKKGTRGEHWVAFFVNNEKNIEYFDSYAAEPNEDITKYLSNFLEIKMNNYKIQSPFSDSCGHFCVYFIFNRCIGINFREIIKNLLNSKNTIDLMLKFFVSLLIK